MHPEEHPPRRRRPTVWALAVVLVLGSLALAWGASGEPPSGSAGPLVPASPGATEFIEPPAPPAPSGMPHVRIDELPPEAIVVLDLIEQGGPFRYDQDGDVFENRERLLPARPMGHYREYTVDTPGEDDRGARRIVAGADGERYWTADHYDSFAWIAE
jgi:ribonuclease T1